MLYTTNYLGRMEFPLGICDNLLKPWRGQYPGKHYITLIVCSNLTPS